MMVALKMFKTGILLLVLLGDTSFIWADERFRPSPLHPGPWVDMTRGSIWPKPKLQDTYASFLVLDPNTFSIKVGLKRWRRTILRNLKCTYY